MHTDIDELSRNLYCLRSELLGPIITMNGAYKLWIRDAPETANKTVQQIGTISEQLLSEIHPLPNTFDLQSTDIAAKQLHSLASKWEKDLEELSHLINKVKATDFHMEDVALEELLKKIFLNGFQKFQSYVQYLKLAQAEHLNQRDGFAKVLNIDSSKQNIR